MEQGSDVFPGSARATWQALRGWRPGRARFPLRLRFSQPAQEAGYRASAFRRNLASTRAAYLLGIGLWLTWGLIVADVVADDRSFDLAVRFGVLIPILLVGLALTFVPGYRRAWEPLCAATIWLTSLAWSLYVVGIDTDPPVPPDYGYVGVILMVIFSYTLVRLRFVWVAAVSAAVLLTYQVVVAWAGAGGRWMGLAIAFQVAFAALGLIASFALERLDRALYLRERDLDRERARSDALLSNTLPEPIVGRLKAREAEAGQSLLADGLSEVSVLFADVVGFTPMSARVSPEQLVEALDGLFSRFDTLADRFGLEKIKTVGDAYMAVAGAPEPCDDHAGRTAAMALAMLGELEGLTWPDGSEIRVRVGIASGPAVAGVIGHRRFAYDLWGDTVNLASRLESASIPGSILVSEGLAARLDDRYDVSEPVMVDLKGKGPTPARWLRGGSVPTA